MTHSNFQKNVREQRVKFSTIVYNVLKDEKRKGNVTRLSFVSENQINVVFSVYSKNKDSFFDLSCIIYLFDERKSLPSRGKRRKFPPEKADIVVSLSEIKSLVSGFGRKTFEEKKIRLDALYLRNVFRSFCQNSVA